MLARRAAFRQGALEGSSCKQEIKSKHATEQAYLHVMQVHNRPVLRCGHGTQRNSYLRTPVVSGPKSVAYHRKIRDRVTVRVSSSIITCKYIKNSKLAKRIATIPTIKGQAETYSIGVARYGITMLWSEGALPVQTSHQIYTATVISAYFPHIFIAERSGGHIQCNINV